MISRASRSHAWIWLATAGWLEKLAWRPQSHHFVPPLCPTTLSHHRSHHSKGARARPPEARRCWGPSAPRPRAAAGPLARHGPQSTPLFNEARHLGGSLTRLQVGEHERPLAAHALGILLHHLERGAHV